MSFSFSRRRAAATLLASVSLLVAGCSTLPSSGPTAHDVIKGARQSQEPLRFQIVDLDTTTVSALRSEDRALAAEVPTLATLAVAEDSRKVDEVGPGDVLAISIFEVGVSLFGGGTGSALTATYDPSAHPQLFPDITVGGNGDINLPYLGVLHVQGRSTDEVEQMIDDGLRGLSQRPQAVVTIKKNLSNTVFISGDVRKAGRFELSLNRERLLDAIAASGGSEYSAEDTIVRFARGGRSLDERMGFIHAGSADDLPLLPGDRVELIKRPRSYTTFGATSKAQQVPFENGDVSLAEAIARAGGPADGQADPSAVFLFRYDSVPDAPEAGLPKLYRINLLKPESYLFSQRIMMRDKDVIYFANARANQPSKLVAILNQLFSPFVTARAISQ
jgi:polysaccharide export outer membrane protein